MTQHRNRPRISTTLSPYTTAVIASVAKEQAFDKIGPTIDYIVADWVAFKRAALTAAFIPSIPEPA